MEKELELSLLLLALGVLPSRIGPVSPVFWRKGPIMHSEEDEESLASRHNVCDRAVVRAVRAARLGQDWERGYGLYCLHRACQL